MADKTVNPIDTMFDTWEADQKRKQQQAAVEAMSNGGAISPQELAKMNADSWGPDEAVRIAQSRKTGDMQMSRNPNATPFNDTLNAVVGSMFEGGHRMRQGLGEIAGQKTRPAGAAPADTTGTQKAAKGLSDVVRGGFQVALPPAAALNPIGTGVGMLTAAATSKATDPLTKNLPYGYRELAQDGASAAVGYGAKKLAENPGTLLNVVRHPLASLAQFVMGKGGASAPNAAKGPGTPATGTPKTASEVAVEKALAKAAGDKAYAAANPKPAKPAATAPQPKGFAGFADPASTASTVTGSPVQSRLLGQVPTGTPIGSLPLNPPQAPSAPKFGPPADNMAEVEPWNQQVRQERSANATDNLRQRTEATAARTNINRDSVDAANTDIRNVRPKPGSPAPTPPKDDMGDNFRRMQDAKLEEGLKQDAAGRWMKSGKLVPKAYMQQLADKYGFKDWQ